MQHERNMECAKENGKDSGQGKAARYASESRFLWRGSPPGGLKVLDALISNEPYTTVSLALAAMAASSLSVMSIARFKGLGVRGAKRGCLAIGAVKQGISGSDTGIRLRFFVQHDLDKHVEGFNRVLARKLLDAVRCFRSTDRIAARAGLKASVHMTA